MRRFILSGILIALAPGLNAQEKPKLAAAISMGFDKPVNTIGKFNSTGWNLRVGGGYNFTPRLGVLLTGGFDSMSVSKGALAELGYRNGNLNIFSLTLDPIVHIKRKGRVGVYATGGGGYFRQIIHLDSPIPPLPGIFQPIYGFDEPFTTNFPFSYSVNKPGIEGGVGITFFHRWWGDFFAEARYVEIFSGSYHTNYIPVTFGVRRK